MGGQKFQYDESGNTFFYFVLSFLLLILAPSTYYLWPRREKEDPERKKDECRCQGCVQKDGILLRVEPKKRIKRITTYGLLIFGWLVFFAIAYKVAQFDYEYANFDPYEILNVDPSSSQAEIKKAYRKLSLIYHPDKETGDEKTFMKLTKAYQALTDEEARKNWERYGNPDGPGAMSFGIALPSWIVEKENSVWVLGLYALVFMVGLPTVVGMWWYKSIRYSGEQVLLGTTQMYYYYFHKTTLINMKRVIMILAASLEFDRRHNKEVGERASDNEEVPALIKQLPNLSEKNKEYPLCCGYSVKARALLHAHLFRIQLSDTLEQDRQFVVRKGPYLLQEIVNCVSQLVLLAHAGRVNRLPDLRTIENCMRLSPMIVQGLWDKSPLLQLPYVTEDMLKYFVTKKRQIRSIQQFVQLKDEERRSLLKSLDPQQYDNAMKMCAKLPYIKFEATPEVVDDEAPEEFTAGAIVTVTVTLSRDSLAGMVGESHADHHMEYDGGNEEDSDEDVGGGDGRKKEEKESVKKPVWQSKAKKGGKKKKGGGNKKVVKQQKVVAPVEEEAPKEEKEGPRRRKKVVEEEESGRSESEADKEESGDEDVAGKEIHSMLKAEEESEGEDEEDWDKFQNKMSKKEKALEGKSKVSHPVHCPFFPEDKQEYWWVYVSDRKNQMLITAPYIVTDLVSQEEVQLKFTAPPKPGVYTFSVCLRSDSYLGFDQVKDLKLDVKEAKKVEHHPQWEFSEDEEDKDDDAGDESEFATDDDDDSDQAND